MSYSDILKNKIKTTNQIKSDELKPGWIVLNRHNYLDNKNKPIIEIDDILNKVNDNTNNMSLIHNINEKYDLFDLKFGFIISDFYIEMKDDLKNNAYNILDNQSNSGELQDFVLRNINITTEQQDDNSFESDEDSINYFSIDHNLINNYKNL